MLQALSADERETLWRLLSRALAAAEPGDDDVPPGEADAVYAATSPS